jgi:hypothetical protein
VIMPAKCVSSVSPRFHYRRLAFCFLPLAAILESVPSPFTSWWPEALWTMHRSELSHCKRQDTNSQQDLECVNIILEVRAMLEHVTKIKDFQMRRFYRIMLIVCQTQISSWEKGRGIFHTHTHPTEEIVKQRQIRTYWPWRLEWCIYKPRNVSSHQWLESQGMNFLLVQDTVQVR